MMLLSSVFGFGSLQSGEQERFTILILILMWPCAILFYPDALVLKVLPGTFGI